VKALVLYDTTFGNTEHIAEAITLTLQEALQTRLASVTEIVDLEATLATGIDLLVVGGPTQRHGISDPLNARLAQLGDRRLDGLRTATFDTRLRGSRLVTGSAAARLATLLRHHGAWVVVPPASFLVGGREGPLRDGELEHARTWARQVLSAAGVRMPSAARVPAAH
jgi:flavodoxin